MSDTLTAQVSLYGRLADELTRQALGFRDFKVGLARTGIGALAKHDGYFVFGGLRSAPLPYGLTLNARDYRTRELNVLLPTSDPVEVSLPGEDELYTLVEQVDLGQSQVRFATIPFLPTINTGAEVMGPGGFSANLAAPLEGSDVQFAQLSSVAGLSPGDLLRFVRSPNLMMRPGPYYAFPRGMTLAAFQVVENAAGQPPLDDVALEIDQIDDQALSTSNIGGLDLHLVALPGPPPVTLIMGPDDVLLTRTDARGYAVFYFPEGSSVTRLRVQVSRVGYAPATSAIDLTPGERTFQSLQLNRV